MTFTYPGLRQILKSALCVALAAALAGCNTPEPKLARVKLQTANHTVIFNTATSYLSSYEIGHLKHFIDTLPAAAVSYAGISANPSDPHNATRSALMRNYLMREGIDSSVIHIVPAFTAMDGESMLITVQYAVAVPPASCPDWSKNSVANYNNTDMSGFGCAYTTNLAVQLANPADLYGGHAVAQTDGARDSAALQKYLSGASMSASSGSSGASGASAAGSSGSSGGTSSP